MSLKSIKVAMLCKFMQGFLNEFERFFLQIKRQENEEVIVICLRLEEILLFIILMCISLCTLHKNLILS